MSDNCLVTKLMASVNNDSLPYLDYVKIRINPNVDGVSSKLFRITYVHKNTVVGEILSGHLYLDAQHTDEVFTLESGNTDYRQVVYYLTDVAEILVKKSELWALGDISSTYPNICWYTCSLNELLPIPTSHLDLSTWSQSALYVPETTMNVEEWFVNTFNYLKYLGTRLYDKITTGYMPEIRNGQQSALDAQSVLTFNGQPFYNKQLFMSPDYDNNSFTLYDTGSLGAEGWTISNPVATYDGDTGEWAYN